MKKNNFLLFINDSQYNTNDKNSSSSSSNSSSDSDSLNLVIGISMVLINLFLDAYTNNEQDSIYKKYGISSFQMMKYINVWQVSMYVWSHSAPLFIVLKNHNSC